MSKDYYKYFRWLSLDIVLGAIFFLAFLEQYYQVDLSLAVYFALASAIWLIYTCDHLIDARKVKHPSSKRHQFHREHFKSLVLIGGFVFILALVNVYNLPETVIKTGALLSACCIGYLMLVFFFSKLWVKELLVAVVYSVGVFLAPLTMNGSFEFIDVILVLQLSLIAFLNLMIFSYYDAGRDLKDGFNSLVLRLGLQKSTWTIHVTAFLSIGFSVALWFIQGTTIQLLYLCMSLLLHSLHIMPRFYTNNDRFRTVGDGVFYLSAFFLLLYL